jgi:hypothetical protein
MHTGTLIDDLIAAVERAEERVHAEPTMPADGMEPWFAAASGISLVDNNLQGVA